MTIIKGAAGLSYLPLRAHIAIAVAARVYRQIGVQIAATGYGWHQAAIHPGHKNQMQPTGMWINLAAVFAAYAASQTAS